MASTFPVQMAINANNRKPPNGTITVPSPQPVVQTTNPSNMLSETTAATWMAVGSLAESLGDLEKALASYDSALRHSPNNPDILTKLANVYRSKDIFFKAAEFYEQALNSNPENGETWGLLGHCYLMLDDLQRAYAAYQRALYYLDNPNVPKLWHGIGILYDRYGSLEYAEEAFVRVLELDPNFDKSNEIYFRLGIIYKHQGKLQAALECFQYILNNPPLPLTQPDVWFQIGSVLEQQKDWSGAKDAYEKVLQVNPQHAKVLQQLGCLYSQAEAPPQKSSSGTSQLPQPFHQDLNIALKYLLQSLEIDQSDAHSWYYLGRVHMMRGDFNAAYEAFQQAVNRDSRNPTFWCSIGVLYYQIAQYRDALDAYTRAIRLNPYISEVWYDLGTLYETCNNQISDALDAYRQAERLDPGNPHIKARLDQLLKCQQGKVNSPSQHLLTQQPKLPQEMILESNQNHQFQMSQPHLLQSHLPQPGPTQGSQIQPPVSQIQQPTTFPPGQPHSQNLPPVHLHPPLPPQVVPLKASAMTQHDPGLLIAPASVKPFSYQEENKFQTNKDARAEVKKEENKHSEKLPPIQRFKEDEKLNSQTAKRHLEDKKDNNPSKKQSTKKWTHSKDQKIIDTQVKPAESHKNGNGNSNGSGNGNSNENPIPAHTEDNSAEATRNPLSSMPAPSKGEAGSKLKEDENENDSEGPEKQAEAIEPPLRKVLEDEDYDDE